MLPKKFLKMSIAEQEEYLVKKLSELYKQEQHLRKVLSQVRGNKKIEVDIDRPDLLAMRED